MHVHKLFSQHGMVWVGLPLFVGLVCRYGDPMDPTADLKSMHTLATSLVRPGALLFLAVPVGRDRIVFNLHRVYGCVCAWEGAAHAHCTNASCACTQWHSWKQT